MTLQRFFWAFSALFFLFLFCLCALEYDALGAVVSLAASVFLMAGAAVYDGRQS